MAVQPDIVNTGILTGSPVSRPLQHFVLNNSVAVSSDEDEVAVVEVTSQDMDITCSGLSSSKYEALIRISVFQRAETS